MEREGLEHVSIVGILVMVVAYVMVRLEMCFGWDEAMYGCIVRSLSNSLWNFTVCGVPALHKPPAYPYVSLVASKVLGIAWGLRAVASVSGILAAIMSYRICLEIYSDRKVGLLCGFLVSTNPLMWYFSTRCLSDSMGVLTFTSAVLLLIRAAKSMRMLDLLMLGSALGAATEARYTNAIAAVLLAASFLVYKVGVRRLYKAVAGISAGALATITPFLALNFKLYRHPVKGPYFASRLIRLDTPVSPLEACIWLIMYMNLLLPLMLYRLVKEKPSRDEALLAIWILLVVGSVLCLPHKEERFFMPAVPPLSALASRCIVKLRSRREIITAVTMLNIIGFSWLYAKTASMGCAEKEAGVYVANHPKPGIIVSELVPQIAFYSRKLVVRFPPSASEFYRAIVERSVGYVVLSTGRNRSPEYAWRMLEQGIIKQVFVAESRGIKVVVAEPPFEVAEDGD